MHAMIKRLLAWNSQTVAYSATDKLMIHFCSFDNAEWGPLIVYL